MGTTTAELQGVVAGLVGVVKELTGTFSTESFHGDGDVGGRKRLGRGRRCSRQIINL